MKKKNGFTLIELLIVVVILGIMILLSTYILTNTINNSRKDSFIRTVDSYIAHARTQMYSTTYPMPFNPDTAVIVSLRSLDLDGQDSATAKSPYDELWDMDETYTAAYVVIHNYNTAANPQWTYYFIARDKGGNCIVMTEEGQATREKITVGCDIPIITADSKTLYIPNEDKEVQLTPNYIFLR